MEPVRAAVEHARIGSVNGSREPVRFLAVTNAPLAFDIYRDENFVFNCPYSFSKTAIYGEEDYFEVGKKRYVSGLINIWETNFIPDIKCGDAGEPRSQRRRFALGAVRDGRQRAGRPSGRVAGGQISQSAPPWSRRDHRRHEVGRYVLLWHKQWGMHPYTDGHEDKVIDINWGEGKHLLPARRLVPPALQHRPRTGAPSRRALRQPHSSVGFQSSHQKTDDDVFRSVDEGGWMITYENEDPEIPKRYQAALRANGVVS